MRRVAFYPKFSHTSATCCEENKNFIRYVMKRLHRAPINNETPAGKSPAVREGIPFHNPGQMATLIMSAMDAIITIDSRQRIVLFNAAAEAMFRIPAREVLGEPIDRFIPPRYRSVHHHHVELFGSTNTSMRTMEHLGTLTAVRADGEEFPIEASISQSGLDAEKLYTVILRDITSRVAAEKELERLNRELEARVARRTEELADEVRNLESFSAAVSHDLRAPVRRIRGFANLILSDEATCNNAETRRYLGFIRDSARRMELLIDDLLAFARCGTMTMEFSDINMNGVLNDVLGELDGRGAIPAVRWITSSLPSVQGDPGMMKLVWSNLISNAVKFSRNQSEPVIEIGHLPLTGETVTYFVRDNGAGFDPMDTGKLFTAFNRLHREEEFEGTGIGLANVRRIIERHGGTVSAEGIAGAGATFYFTLPLKQHHPSSRENSGEPADDRGFPTRTETDHSSGRDTAK